MGDERVWVKERNFRDIFMIEETFSIFIEKVNYYFLYKFLTKTLDLELTSTGILNLSYLNRYRYWENTKVYLGINKDILKI